METESDGFCDISKKIIVQSVNCYGYILYFCSRFARSTHPIVIYHKAIYHDSY